MGMYRQRIQKVQSNLREAGLKTLVVADPVSFEYLTGVKVAHVGERLLAFALPAEGTPVLFINRLFPIQKQEGFDIVYHDDTDLATKDLAPYLPSGEVGIDRFLYSQFLIELLEQRKDITPKVGSFAVEQARMIKDEAEQQALYRSAQICDAAFSTIPSLLREGMTELELAGLLGEAFRRLGDPGAHNDALICFGEGAAEPHHVNGGRRLKKGDAVLVDAGQCSFGYYSDMTRTFFFQSVTDEERSIYDIVVEANRRGREKVKAGVPFKEVDRAARDYIASKGYGEYFTHRTGHNIGMQVHEEPSVSGVNALPIQEGMAFSIEPGIYLPGRFGVRIEDIVIAQKDGAWTLNSYTKELQVIS